MTKPETIAQLKRKVERLEAQVVKLTESQTETFAHYVKYMGGEVELRIRIRQAIQILTGEDEG